MQSLAFETGDKDLGGCGCQDKWASESHEFIIIIIIIYLFATTLGQLAN